MSVSPEVPQPLATFPRISLLARICLFLFPRATWRQELTDFHAGQKVWEVPGRPDANKLSPWPLDWIPHRLLPKGTYADDDPKEKVGFEFLPAVCADTGRWAPVGVAVACHRCAVPLHEAAAHMAGSFSVPTCRWCYFCRF